MRGKIAPALVALAAGVAACGGTEDAEPLATVGPPAKTAPSRAPRSDPDRSCAAQGIDGIRLWEGVCTEGSMRYVIANRGGALRLESLVASVGAIAVERQVGDAEDAVRPQRGAFLRVTLTVTNRREYPQNFEVGQTMLGIGEDTFREAEAAERAHAGAIATRGGGRLKPGATVRGDVLFDVPPEAVEEVASSGRFFVANFGERPGETKPPSREQREQEQIASAIGGRIAPETTELGQMRLYAAPAGAAR